MVTMSGSSIFNKMLDESKKKKKVVDSLIDKGASKVSDLKSKISPKILQDKEKKSEKQEPHVQHQTIYHIEKVESIENISGSKTDISDSVIQKSKIGEGTKEQDVFSVCPFCGKKFNFKKTPKYCPYCSEELG